VLDFYASGMNWIGKSGLYKTGSLMGGLVKGKEKSFQG